MTRLHLVDGTFELFRAYYSKRPDHKTPDGRPFKAVAGIVSSLIFLLQEREEAVTHLAVAFDNPIRSFRNDLFDGYKSDEGVEPALREQFDAAEDAARALGVVAWRCDRVEADDAMATAAVRFADRVDQVRILSPDKDLGQVVRGDHIVQVDRIRNRVIDEAAVRGARGVSPVQIPALLALVGDDADGIPGIEGFGAKTAAALLAKFGTIDDIPDDPALWTGIRGADRLATTLAGQRKEANLYEKLATLDTAVSLKETFEDLKWGGYPAGFRAWCAGVGLEKLATRAGV